MKTVLDCIESGTSYLQNRGIDGARRNMEWLVSHQIGCSRIELYTQFDRPMTENELIPLRELLKSRGMGEPLQHLLGTVEFCGREFASDKRALIPRPETEELVEEALKLEFPRPARVLDMGTGSGVIGITIALSLADHCREAVLVDISSEALGLAHENSEIHSLTPVFLESDYFAEVRGTFDLIVANLPYIADCDREDLSREVSHDPERALFAGADGLDAFRQVLPEAGAYLSPGGWLALEIGAGQGEQVTSLAEKSGLQSPRLAQDLSGNPRFVFAQGPSRAENSPAPL
ncbi:MAG: peptide chain release factor N(5)-glutamine methyltransferase [Roseibacillus sp.]|nr:peptide chain release factor N(5)-glutamine methyltransferase [Roseibacillus sp.]